MSGVDEAHAAVSILLESCHCQNQQEQLQEVHAIESM